MRELEWNFCAKNNGGRGGLMNGLFRHVPHPQHTNLPAQTHLCLSRPRGWRAETERRPPFRAAHPRHLWERPPTRNASIIMPTISEWAVTIVLPLIVTAWIVLSAGSKTFFSQWCIYMFLDATYGHLFHAILLIPARWFASRLVSVLMSCCSSVSGCKF